MYLNYLYIVLIVIAVYLVIITHLINIVILVINTVNNRTSYFDIITIIHFDYFAIITIIKDINYLVNITAVKNFNCQGITTVAVYIGYLLKMFISFTIMNTYYSVGTNFIKDYTFINCSIHIN